MKSLKKLALCAASTVAAAAALSVTAFAESAASTSESGSGNTTLGVLLLQFAPFIGAIVLLYLLLLRPQQKREKQAQEMRENVAVGDEVCTAGGIVGIVLKVEDDTVVLETGAERNRIRIKKWAIHENITQMEAQQAAERERKAARQNGIATAAANDAGTKKTKKDE